jgi:hypothetical protein
LSPLHPTQVFVVPSQTGLFAPHVALDVHSDWAPAIACASQTQAASTNKLARRRTRRVDDHAVVAKARAKMVRPYAPRPTRM